MLSWVGMTPTVETVLLISMAVGGFWCIFVCICQILLRAAKTARKNTAMYRRDHSSTTPLHHGATQLQESHPLRPLFVSSRGPAPGSSHRGPHLSRIPSVEASSVNARGGRIGSSADGLIHPDYVERVILPEYVDRLDSPGEEINEEPPPYDAIEEHMDFPAPPAYTDLFPPKT
ncbi:uncharacterized protein LOC143299950 isoform X2 [Babylonia areolata]|uniref:uncharacterized protein LOC143299950 isoform X2 n=1 Tax=Babylonia areolata TaxID=304850 RepID=UPI003FD1B7C0